MDIFLNTTSIDDISSFIDYPNIAGSFIPIKQKLPKSDSEEKALTVLNILEEKTLFKEYHLPLEAYMTKEDASHYITMFLQEYPKFRTKIVFHVPFSKQSLWMTSLFTAIRPPQPRICISNISDISEAIWAGKMGATYISIDMNNINNVEGLKNFRTTLNIYGFGHIRIIGNGCEHLYQIQAASAGLLNGVVMDESLANNFFLDENNQ